MRAALPSRFAVLIAASTLLGACAETNFVAHTAKQVVTPVEDTGESGNYKVGKPYQVKGVWYYPAEDYSYDETGIASWYGQDFHGKYTSNGEIFDMNTLSAAHKILPLPCFVRVTNLDNGRSLVVRVNDRGPFYSGRIIDMSRRGAQMLGFENQGTAHVRVQIMAEESRALAARLKSKQEGTTAVAAAPRDRVSAEALPPPGGAKQAPQPKVAAAKATVVATSAAPSASAMPNPVTGEVKQGAAKVTQMFIQAGAFQRYENANRMSTKLSGIGTPAITAVKVGGQEIYRVRLGPVPALDDADRLLDKVIHAGYPDARLVVD